MTLFLIKFIHTIIFVVFSWCVLYVLFCSLTNRYSLKTTVALLLILVEGVILLLNNWQCPLTTLAENLGASDGQVADIFLPKWLADRIFPLCTPLFLGSAMLLLTRRLWNRRTNFRNF